MRVRRFLVVLALAGAAAWGCSLLATSREEATSTLDEKEGGEDEREDSGDLGFQPDGACAQTLCGSSCCFACTQNTCVGCRQNARS